jgi:hypothetical protein
MALAPKPENIVQLVFFIRGVRWLMDTNRDLARKIEALEKKYDEQFATVFEAIKQLVAPPEPRRKQIGFHPQPHSFVRQPRWPQPTPPWLAAYFP